MMNASLDLYQYYSKLAEAATDKAETGNCKVRWEIAANMWDIAMQHSPHSKFRQDIAQALFVGEFKFWLTKHPKFYKRNETIR